MSIISEPIRPSGITATRVLLRSITNKVYLHTEVYVAVNHIMDKPINLELMRQLLEDEVGALEERWAWVYLAARMGEDLLSARHYAIDANGDAYDDDVGGACLISTMDSEIRDD